MLVIGCVIFGSLPYSDAENEDKLAILETKSGKITMEFFPNDAPNHVKNFIKLADSGFYDQTIFHRVIKDFMIQGGDNLTKPGAYETTNQWGTGGPGYFIDAEFNTIKHNRGIVSMARSQDPNSAGSQFFIVHKNSNFLDGQYTVFGRIVTQESFDTLDKIANLATISGGTIPLDWGAGEILGVKIAERSNVDNLLSLDEPARTDQLSTTNDGPYINEELGITFDPPTGWFIQEPTKTDPTIPDIVMIGPKVNDHSPIILLLVEPRNNTNLDAKIIQRNEFLQDAINSGQLEIILEKKTNINGNEAFQKDVKGIFVLDGNNATILFREVIILSSDKFYTVTYSNEETLFDGELEKFNDVLESFSIQSEDDIQLKDSIAYDIPSDDTSSNVGGCLVATATYGSELAPQVQFLREVRDNILLSTTSGTTFMTGFNHVYYSFSPIVSDLQRENPVFKEAVKLFITPILSTLSIMTLADEGSESQVLALGISVIALNLGMYIAAPAIIINRLRK